MADKLNITELDFVSIRNNLKNYLRNQSAFTDYDFEGSSISVLLDILAYNTHYNAYYQNMVANEMFLDSAVVRNSVISHAKHIGYTATSRRSAIATIDIGIIPTDNAGTLTIPRFQEFFSESIDGVNYNFVTTKSYTTIRDCGVFNINGIEIVEGFPRVLTFSYNSASNPKREFTISDITVDTSTLLVAVQSSSTNTDSHTYTISTDATEINSTSKVFFLEGGLDDTYKIKFGDGVIGSNLSNGNIVIISYVSSSADAANKANSFTTGSISGYNQIVINANTAAAGGAERETIQSIKFNAPHYYSSQNRAVTTSDFEVLLKQNYPAIDTVSVWGGEENTPPIYGKVYISFKPKSGVLINDTEKARIIDEYIKPLCLVTVTPEIVDPEYIYLKFDVIVEVDLTLTTLTQNQIASLVQNAVFDYNDTTLQQFGVVFVQSKLQSLIDNVSSGIVGNEIKTRVEKRFMPQLNALKTYYIDFALPLHRGGGGGGLYDSLDSTPFYVNDASGTYRLAYLDEAPNSFTGVDEIVITDSGYSYLEAPTVTITGDGSGATAEATIVNGKVTKITMITRGTGYSRAIVTITGGDGFGAKGTAIVAARYGTLRTFYYNELAEKIIINAEAGTINYATGLIVLNNFKIEALDSDHNDIRIAIEPETKIIDSRKNQILLIDTDGTDSVVVTPRLRNVNN
jgi:hypothetical protein